MLYHVKLKSFMKSKIIEVILLKMIKIDEGHQLKLKMGWLVP